MKRPTLAMVCRVEQLPTGQTFTSAGPIESLSAAKARLFAENRPSNEVYMLVPVTEVVRLAAIAREVKESLDREGKPYTEQLQSLIWWLNERNWRV